MGVQVHLYSGLSSYTDGQSTVEVSGRTVGECLNELVGRFPHLKSEIFDSAGRLFSHIFISINLNSAKPEQLEQPLEATDVLYIIRITAGG